MRPQEKVPGPYRCPRRRKESPRFLYASPTACGARGTGPPKAAAHGHGMGIDVPSPSASQCAHAGGQGILRGGAQGRASSPSPNPFDPRAAEAGAGRSQGNSQGWSRQPHQARNASTTCSPRCPSGRPGLKKTWGNANGPRFPSRTGLVSKRICCSRRRRTRDEMSTRA